MKSVYNVCRSIIMSMIVLLVIVYVGLYVVLSVPSVQRKVKEITCEEVSKLVGGNLKIRNLTVRPFSEVVLEDVALDSPEGLRCADIGKIAAGIDLWSLLSDRRIVFNYAEIIGMQIKISQDEQNAPLNIQFLIDALSSKDKNKPPSAFDLKIRNIVVRDSKASFSRPWLNDSTGLKHKLAAIDIDKLRMDLSIPVLRNDLYRFDVRNIQFEVSPGIEVRSLSTQVSYVKDNKNNGAGDRLLIKNLSLAFPNSNVSIGDLDLDLSKATDLHAAINGKLTPSDFSVLIPQLSGWDSSWNLDIDAILKGKSIKVSEFRLVNPVVSSEIGLIGSVEDYDRKDSLSVTLDFLKMDLSPALISDALHFLPKGKEGVSEKLMSIGRFSMEAEGAFYRGDKGEISGRVTSEVGELGFVSSIYRLRSGRPAITLSADADELEIGRILSSEKIGQFSGELEMELTGLDQSAEGWVRLRSDEFSVLGNIITGTEVDVRKINNDINLALKATSDEASINIDGNAHLDGPSTRVNAILSLNDVCPYRFGLNGKIAESSVSGQLNINSTGNNADNILGELEITDLKITKKDGKNLVLPKLTVSVDTLNVAERDYDKPRGKGTLRNVKLSCDWLEARMKGNIHPSSLVRELKGMVGSVVPSLLTNNQSVYEGDYGINDFAFDMTVKGASAPYVYFDTPVRPLADIPIKGEINAPHGKASLMISTPHMQQGKNKLLREIDLSLDLDAFLGMAKVRSGLIFPAKKGDAELAIDINAVHDKVNLNLGINPTLTSSVKGNVLLTASLSRIPDPFKPKGNLSVSLGILPSSIRVGDKVWNIADGGIDFAGNRLAVRNFLISHDRQFVKIDGTASDSADDIVKVKLNDIDLEYIFGILNINYVSFGGMATGEVVGRRLFSKSPIAATEFLRVKGLSYNGAVIGDGDLAADYDAYEKKVGIYAVVRDPMTRERRASIDGGIWVTRDSLSFGFDANRVNVGIMKPFVSAFCSDLHGEASGRCKLYGTFSDIDLVGGLKADTLSMKLDFTNTWYHAGNDSVFLRKGIIEIPPLTLYDDERHTAEFSGWLRHTYFHNPVFNFRLKDARSLLCYNTNEKINPLWYGTIYGSGHAQIIGQPSLIEIDMNMTTEEGSRFYYVISDAEDVAQYSFLTFTDRRKATQESVGTDSVPEYLHRFRKQNTEMESESSNVILSLKGTVTNDALVTLVMDPKAGDNIVARGQGALQMDYNLASNDLRMIGTYVLDEGNYYFTLQDIIIKNFNIRKGSLIKFDGDPMKANLDITATYRVNTNLTDLDKSFSTDKELNRTNVPVDAVLLVDGPMTNPDITFDIELPSLTSDVERKVKSIVSTNDMMSRQIIYLLALNRFYTPEYTGGQTSSGSEWSSMASSTISSQLSNILSQMTDKLDVSPSFRSDKGDFSDMEFDLALSSRLLNNRLLINGNFGYRDKNTSNTQFVGDFDIEYLLSKNGNLRLKAYNHFNDQNYYLRSALTTQGVGLVYRRDFDRLFRRKKKDDEHRNDSIPDTRREVSGNRESEASGSSQEKR